MSVHLIEVTYSQKGGEVMQTIQEGRPGGGVRLLAEAAAGPMSEVIQRSAAEGAAGNALFTDKGGPVIAGAHLHLIFWGKAWSDNPSPPVSAVVDAVNSTLMGPYMTGLVQYRNVGLASLGGTELATTSDPSNPFSDEDIENLISGLITQGSLPNPAMDDQLLFLVILPAGVRSAGPFDGEHSFFSSGVSTYIMGGLHMMASLSRSQLSFRMSLWNLPRTPKARQLWGLRAPATNRGGARLATSVRAPRGR